MKIIEMMKIKNQLQTKVLNLIDYNSDDNSPIVEENCYWAIEDDELILIEAETSEDVEEMIDNGDYYVHTISSYSAKGEKLYLGEEDDFTFVMAYPQDESYDNTTIFMLDNNKKINI